MKKIKWILVGLIGLSGCATTNHAWTEKVPGFELAGRQRVAIFPLDGDRTGAVADALTTEFMGMGFEVVERSNLRAILDELKLDYSGALDQAQKKAVARASDATAIVFGSVKTTLGGKIYFMDFRFVDITSGEVLWSMNYINESFKGARVSVKEIAKSIAEELNCRVISEKSESRSMGAPRISLAQNPSLRGKKYKKVALMQLSGTNYYGEENAVYGALVTDFIGNGVELVERKDLNGIIKEQVDNESGLYNQVPDFRAGVIPAASEIKTSSAAYSKTPALSRESLQQISKLTGADALLLGSFQSLAYEPFVFSFANLRVLDLETGKIAWSASYYNTDVSPENYIYTADWLRWSGKSGPIFSLT